ncbi:MAG TPA: hypothetical protein PLM53_11795 [Spirochaetota bacterium]|nr:hypothetical protein [Spirochaetota bacterium]HPL16494.1 hypothetical protein [Spirochaetota bacterium]HQF09235.1 hypothetical protein [Spirochaetota bacterium]HQH97776.1 hypothetical protein [Spirochaetota bacterium]HQJ71479.1 hypothetical protein [Spirochaetota bacterium]
MQQERSLADAPRRRVCTCCLCVLAIAVIISINIGCDQSTKYLAKKHLPGGMTIQVIDETRIIHDRLKQCGGCPAGRSPRKIGDYGKTSGPGPNDRHRLNCFPV